MARLHFITGKGGVGRSTFAAALATRLSERNEGPVLLLEIQGSGRSLQLCGLTGPMPYANTALPRLSDVWGARMLPRESFRQYFSLLLALGDEFSAFASATATLRERIVDAVVGNKVVSAFIDVCPGLEPAVLLGKVHWESTEGHRPDSQVPWRHVVVDGPATGHGLMLFKSTNALTEVFNAGPVHKQAESIMAFVRDPRATRLYVVSTPEELPVRETLDMFAGLRQMGIHPYAVVANRCSPPLQPGTAGPRPLSPAWAREAEFEREALIEQRQLIRELEAQTRATSKFIELPEIFAADPADTAAGVARALAKGEP